jgi:menaquinone-dependent protoporphyrinogen oxidase
MRVLVSAASKHGATADISDAIARTLRESDLEVTQAAPDQVHSLEGIDAVVLGSAIYGGRWQTAAKDLVERFEEALRRRPVWLFSSGPVGEPAKPAGDPADIETLEAAVQPREHRVFAGALRRAGLGLGERAIVAAVRAPDGDFRDWADIHEWALSIAEAIKAGSGTLREVGRGLR